MTPPPTQPHTAPETQVSGADLNFGGYSPDLALTGGRGARGTVRWVPDPPIRDDRTDHPDGQIVCACGARAAQACRTRNGRRTNDHSYRTAPRTCRCGGTLERSQHWCTDCSVRRKRELGTAAKAARRARQDTAA
jgi:hypothetical protein